jgi:septal ring factor EnvC (AmiA/AmiB activator)
MKGNIREWWWRRIFLIALASFSIFNFQFSISQKRDIDAQNAVVRQSEERLAEIERQNKALAGDEVRTERDLRVARGAMEAKRKVAADLDKESNRVTKQMNADTRETRRLDTALARLKRDYGRMVYQAWKSHKTTSATLFLLSAKDFNDASRRMNFIRRYNESRRNRWAQIDSMARRLEAGVARLNVQKQELTELKSQSDKLIADLGREQKRYEQALKTLSANKKKLDEEAKREREKIAAAQKEISRIMASQAKAAVAAKMSDADIKLMAEFGDNKGRMPWPTGSPAGGVILHRFGKEKSADGIVSDFKGLIVAADKGAQVRAVFEGTVSWISDVGQFDKCVLVRSGEYVVGYGNIAVPAVKIGDRVATGQTLGRLGTSDNPDRHLVIVSMQRGNEVLNPEEWLR